MEEMELIVTKTLWIPLEEIIEENKLTKNSLDSEIMNAVENYVNELDSCDYDLVSEKDKEKIGKNLKKVLTNKTKGCIIST